MTPVRIRQNQISQERLRCFVGMQNNFHLLKRELDREAKSLLEDILNGVPVEPGSHIAEVAEKFRGRTKKQTLRVR